MKLLVVGGTGATGRLLVRQALEAGHSVTAFGRSQFPATHPNLRREIGDATDAARMHFVVRGHDAVVCLLGASPSDAIDSCSSATSTLLDGMYSHAVSRLLCVTGVMVGHPAPARGLLRRWAEALSPSLHRRLQDRRRQEQIVRSSSLLWTLVRPPTLSDGDARRTYRAVDSNAHTKVSSFTRLRRADLAHFLLTALEAPDTYGHREVLLLPR